MKPIITKQFENKTINAGDNVTLTCETQMDALPIFIFYKLNQYIKSYYDPVNLNRNLNLLQLYATPLQDPVRFLLDSNMCLKLYSIFIYLFARTHSATM